MNEILEEDKENYVEVRYWTNKKENITQVSHMT